MTFSQRRFRQHRVGFVSPKCALGSFCQNPPLSPVRAQVARVIVNNRPETMERSRPHVKVGSSHDAAGRRDALVSRAQRSMKRSGMMRCRPGTAAVSGGPGSAMHHSLALALHRVRGMRYRRPDSSSQSHDVKQPILFPRRVFRARGLHPCFAHPNRGVGGAPRDVRVLGGTPVGYAITRRTRRLRGALRPMTRDARLSALHRSNAWPKIMK